MAKIFESPDHGQTVYVRESGEIERTIYKQDTQLIDQLREDQLWGNIRRLARTDPGLQDLLERAIVYYNLKNTHGN
jgi:hypothetical protein